MNTKIFYFSFDGNTKYAAENIAKELGADIVELKPQKPFPTKGFKKYFISGMKAIFKASPKLQSYDSSLDYDLIIIGTPIWAGSFAPPIRTFLKDNDLSGKKVALFACFGTSEGKCFEQIKKMQPNCNIISTFGLADPLKNNNISPAVEWAKRLKVD